MASAASWSGSSKSGLSAPTMVCTRCRSASDNLPARTASVGRRHQGSCRHPSQQGVPQQAHQATPRTRVSRTGCARARHRRHAFGASRTVAASGMVQVRPVSWSAQARSNARPCFAAAKHASRMATFTFRQLHCSNLAGKDGRAHHRHAQRPRRHSQEPDARTGGTARPARASSGPPTRRSAPMMLQASSGR